MDSHSNENSQSNMNCFFIIYIRCVIRSMLNLTVIELQVQAHSVHLAKLFGR